MSEEAPRCCFCGAPVDAGYEIDGKCFVCTKDDCVNQIKNEVTVKRVIGSFNLLEDV